MLFCYTSNTTQENTLLPLLRWALFIKSTTGITVCRLPVAFRGPKAAAVSHTGLHAHPTARSLPAAAQGPHRAPHQLLTTPQPFLRFTAPLERHRLLRTPRLSSGSLRTHGAPEEGEGTRDAPAEPRLASPAAWPGPRSPPRGSASLFQVPGLVLGSSRGRAGLLGPAAALRGSRSTHRRSPRRRSPLPERTHRRGRQRQEAGRPPRYGRRAHPRAWRDPGPGHPAAKPPPSLPASRRRAARLTARRLPAAAAPRRALRPPRRLGPSARKRQAEV